MPVRSTAPVRICDIGGWTDTRFAGKGAVVNFAVHLPVHVLVFEQPTPEGSEPTIEIEALDVGTRVQLGDVRDIEYDGTLDLLKAAVVRMNVRKSLRIVIWADPPPGSGMGTSSAVGVALLAALGRVTGQSLPRHGLAELAHALEVEELKIECGVQDQYAAAFGGVHFMEIEYPRVRLSPLDLSRDFVDELNERLLLVYSGESRLSGQVHTRVIRNYRGQEGTEQEAMQTLRDCAYRMKDALLAEDFDAVADVMNTNWEAQKALHEGITTDRIEETITVARQAGASGAKVNGAGGGGSLTLLCKPGAEFSVRRAVSQVEGVSLLPCSISFGGVRAWDVSDV